MKLNDIFLKIDSQLKDIEFMPTGFSKVDEFLDGGFMRKELIILGGYTGSGKSYIAGNIFLNISKKGFKTAYFSLEISNEMIVSRLIGSIANIKPTRVMCGFLTPEENQNKISAKAQLNTMNGNMNFYDEIYEFDKIKQEIINNKFDFVVVDFIQNVIGHGKDEYSMLSTIALQFQKLAKECNCCIMVLSQLSNSANKTGVVEYKGSGSIATVCDLGFFIERTIDENGKRSNDEFEINLKKNRRGISGYSFGFKFIQPGGKIQ